MIYTRCCIPRYLTPVFCQKISIMKSVETHIFFNISLDIA